MQDGKKRAVGVNNFNPISAGRGGGQLFAYNFHILSFLAQKFSLHNWIFQRKKNQFLQICIFLQIFTIENKSFPMMYYFWTSNIKFRGSVNWFSSTPAGMAQNCCYLSYRSKHYIFEKPMKNGF